MHGPYGASRRGEQDHGGLNGASFGQNAFDLALADALGIDSNRVMTVADSSAARGTTGGTYENEFVGLLIIADALETADTALVAGSSVMAWLRDNYLVDAGVT